MNVASVQQRDDYPRFHVPRFSLEVAGFLTFLLGAWSGAIPFVGPLFGFNADGSSAWQWSLHHALLSLAPGATACAAGLFMMFAVTSRFARPVLLGAAGVLAAACGAWLIVGPFAWPVLHGTGVFASASAIREFEYWIGYSLGPGGLLVALGAFVLGRPSLVASPAFAEHLSTATASQQQLMDLFGTSS